MGKSKSLPFIPTHLSAFQYVLCVFMKHSLSPPIVLTLLRFHSFSFHLSSMRALFLHPCASIFISSFFFFFSLPHHLEGGENFPAHYSSVYVLQGSGVSPSPWLTAAGCGLWLHLCTCAHNPGWNGEIISPFQLFLLLFSVWEQQTLGPIILKETNKTNAGT